MGGCISQRTKCKECEEACAPREATGSSHEEVSASVGGMGTGASACRVQTATSPGTCTDQDEHCNDTGPEPY